MRALCILLISVLYSLVIWGTDSAPTTSGAKAVEPSTAENETVTLLFGGDVMSHYKVKETAALHGTKEQHHFGFLFSNIKELVESADIAFANLETPISKTQKNGVGPFKFNAPAELAKSLRWAGFDLVSVANNHSMDQGELGLKETVLAVGASELIPLGAGLTSDEASQGKIVTVRGIDIGFIGYTEFINTNGGARSKKPPAYLNILEEQRILKAVAELRPKVHILVCSLHWGIEYSDKPTAQQRKLAKLLHAKGVDILVGHHPHVLQPIVVEKRKGKTDQISIFSLGNLISNQSSGEASPQRDGAMVEVSVVKEGVKSFRVHPTFTFNWTGIERGVKVVLIENEIERINKYLAELESSPYRNYFLTEKLNLEKRQRLISKALGLSNKSKHNRVADQPPGK